MILALHSDVLHANAMDDKQYVSPLTGQDHLQENFLLETFGSMCTCVSASHCGLNTHPAVSLHFGTEEEGRKMAGQENMKSFCQRNYTFFLFWMGLNLKNFFNNT